MNINTGLNPYNSNFVNGADSTRLSQSQSLTGSATSTLKEGEVFEGSVNSIENGKVTIGLANGQTMTARLDSGVSLTPGQSVFFEVKSNDGNLIQLRPVSLNSLEANPTLLKALDMANIAASERTISMVNSMMQNSLSINPESLTAMNRAMINNPGVDIGTLVTMAKINMPLTADNINMFINYASDKALITDNFNIISDTISNLMSTDLVSVSQGISINNALGQIFLDNQIGIANQEMVALSDGQIVNQGGDQLALGQFNGQDAVDSNIQSNQSNTIDFLNQGQNNQLSVNGQVPVEELPSQTSSFAGNQTAESLAQNLSENYDSVNQNEVGNQLINSFASGKDISSFNNLLNNLPDFPKDNSQILSENGNLKESADIKQVFKELTDYFNNHPDMPKDTFNDIVSSNLYRGILKNIISNSFALEPREVTKPGQISKLYERVLKQTEALEKLVANFSGKEADTIKNQTSQIRQNINFMSSANEMYNFVQIPLKMYNQNTDSMLYVRQNKKSSYEAGQEITAFLHFDMEYLGSTDVFISLKETKVGCKWNLADEAAMDLIEDNLDILTERLAKKGFNVTSEVTCGQPKASFAQDFLGTAPVGSEPTSEGIMHRYSFDMRA